ncbi:hypothetical protein KFZ70_13520 [Tamlana fucoidanivorans]|uniref:DUF4258 domain-containing protein n=1 Tax=Allotamlana fucoidanivorans TaxID=2583814 RepID=A0A5C4SQT7_9FLAO|nr:hypothetical protein [Tamlana fucoidanivorans]TNJ46447.1 hypothetical protein FGF67_02140 [Tamlana fucoidanivorans]
MKLIQRIGYYLGGFSMGLIILAFFLNGKKTSCSYGPESRVLKNINSKHMVFSKKAEDDILQLNTDSVTVHTILKKGSIDFLNSAPRKKPCGEYIIFDKTENKKEIAITVKNCDSIATIIAVKAID